MTKDKLRQLNSLIGEMDDVQRRMYQNAPWSSFCASEEEQREREQKIEQLSRWIREIPDSLVRRAVRLRYVDGLQWFAVAMRMGYQNEDTPRKMCERYIKKTNRISDN